MTAGRRKDLIAASILVAVPTLLFIDILAGWSALYSRDIVSYHYPLRTLLREIVLGGEFPYWNPWFSAGQPLAANPAYEVFYPLTWLILLPSFDLGFQLLPIAHIHIALFGMYGLLRSLGVGRMAAVAGAVTFGIGGMTVSTINLFSILFSLAWLPYTCLFARRFMQSRSRLAFALASLFLGLQLLIGEPVTAMQSGLLLGFYALALGWTRGRWRGAVRRVADVAAISLAALAVSAVQTLPAFDHLRDSVRARGFDFAVVSQWSTPWQRITEFVYPHVLGVSLPDSGIPYWGGPLYGAFNSPFLFSVYSGLAVAVFCIAGVGARIHGSRLFVAVAAGSFILALGSHTPLLALLHQSGVFSTFRYPEKFLLIGGFAAIVFAAVVFDRILLGHRKLRHLALGISAATTAFAAVAALSVRTPSYSSGIGRFIGSELRPTLPMIEHARASWIVAAAIGAGLFILLLRVASARHPGWRIAFFAWLLLDLTPLALEVAPRMPASFFKTPPQVVRQFPEDRDGFRLFHYAEWSVHGDTGRQYRHNHPDRYWLMWNGISPMLPAAWNIRTVLEEDFDKTALLLTEDFRLSMLELGTRNWVDVMASMSNVAYLAVWENPDRALARAGGIRKDVQPVRVVGPANNPRYYFARRLVQIRGREDFVRKLRTGVHPRQTAFIERPEFTPAAGRVVRFEETANSIALEVETEGKAYLVMSVTPHKYWRVSIDGQPAEAVVTNVGYQGVVVPQGRHSVEMRYRNPLIATGAIISIAALIGLGACASVRRRPRAR